ncbi:MAG: hypothetical protein ACRD2G_06130, partial [Terriglobia bacterium]
MQQISSFGDDRAPQVQTALRDFQRPPEGIEVRALLTPEGWFARFIWPDWPKRCADAIAREVNEFHDSHAELHRVQQGSQEWVSVTHGWE